MLSTVIHIDFALHILFLTGFKGTTGRFSHNYPAFKFHKNLGGF